MMKTDDINDQAITKDKIRDGNVTAEKLADGAVSTDKLPDGSIKTPKIADGNITTSKLAEASVVTSKIADQNVTKEKIADQSVDNSKLSPEAITYDKLKDKAIITEKINDRAVTTEKIDEKAITNAKIGDSAVDGRVISEASVEKKHLANDSVATEKLQDSAITADKIHIYAVTEEKIEDSAISNSKLADNSVGTSKIKDGNVTNEKVANNTITIDKFDPELRKSIQAATGLPENLVEVIQDVDVEVKSLHSKDEDLQSQIVDKQQQITANDKDIESLKNRSTQMEQSINNIAVTGGASVANTVAYSNTASGLVSINAQGAIDELAEKNATKAEKAEVTAELEKKFDKESILQESGEAEDKVMSQKAVSAKFSDLAKDSANNKQVLFPHELSYYKDITPPSLKFIPNNGIVTETTFLDGIRIFSNAGGHVLYNIATYNQETDSITTTGEYIDLGITSNGVTELFFDSAITLEKNQALVLCISANIYYDNNQSNKDIHIWNYSDSHKMWKKNIGADVAAIYIHRNTILQHKLNKKLDKTNIVQELGTAEDKVMSQKSIKIELDKLVNIQKETDSKQDGKIIDVSNGKEFLFRHELSYYKDITNLSYFIPSFGFVSEETEIIGVRVYSQGSQLVMYTIVTLSEDGETIIEEETDRKQYGYIERGVQIIKFDNKIKLSANQGIALKFFSYYNNTPNDYIWYYSDTSKTWKKNQSAEFPFSYIYSNSLLDAYAERTFNAAVEYCDKKNENKTRVILEDISFNKNLADLVSNWKVDKVKRVISNVGTNKTDIANSIKIKKDYFIDDRRITARISPTTGVSVYIGFKYELNVFNLANVVSVDFQNNIIKVYKEVSTSITSFTALETHIEKQISIDTNYTDYIYEVLCERYGNWGVRVAVYNVTLNHKLCGELILEEFLKNRPKPVQGFMYGYPFLFTVGGNGIELHRLTVSCPTYDDVRMMIVGDSITEGYGTNDINKTYSRLLCRYIGNSIVSSRSGGTLDILNKQIVNEIPIIKPKNILIAFGHNDTWDVSDLSGFKTKLKGIIDTLTSMNINIYIACIPRTNDEHVNTSTNDAIIEVADLYGIYPIRFDIATSKNFKLTDGINTSLFYDNAHLNDKGYQIMADRFLADNDEFVKLEL